jgi:hypothetical protein
MSTISLKEIERRAWKSFFQDGLWDIYLGLLLMAMGISALLSDAGLSKAWHYAIYIGLIVVSMLILWTGKRFVTVPRMGRVKLGPKGKARRKKSMILLIGSFLVGVALFVLALAVKDSRPDWLDVSLVFPAGYVLNMLVVFSLGAYFLDFERLYLIGVMYALPVPADILLHELAGVDASFFAFAVPAAIILTIGLVLFVRFLRDYPVPAVPAEATGDDSR